MDDSEILKHVDHTLLKSVSSWAEIQKLCEEALQYGTASVCVPPSYVRRIHEAYGSQLVLCTVIGFPLGYNTREAKIFEATQAVHEGAAEIDMVINLGDVKNGGYDAVREEIAALKHAVGEKILKVIVETCYLTEAEKIRLCQCVTEAGADYIKTSTGFGSAGATLEDVELFKKHLGPKVKIKAAGGIRSREDMVRFLQAGADRLGTSSAIKLLEEQISNQY
ncbi:MAG TPA: deoxyribose-phosphate aldolase [Peptococcaceae bacterium]|nr:deoxyribose-phosphate aldolase [Peptococcaceae bacterium]